METGRVEYNVEVVCKLAVPIMNQETKSCIALLKVTNELPGRLGNPGCVGIGSDAGQVYTPQTQLNEVDVKSLQLEYFNSEEITGNVLLPAMLHRSSRSNSILPYPHFGFSTARRPIHASSA
jgi:hypothetical protein